MLIVSEYLVKHIVITVMILGLSACGGRSDIELEHQSVEIAKLKRDLDEANSQIESLKNPPIPKESEIEKTVLADLGELRDDLKAAKSIAPNRTFILYVSDSGHLKGVGNNKIGQLGLPEDIAEASRPEVLIREEAFKKVSSRGYGQPQSFALTESGDVYVAGVTADTPSYEWKRVASGIRDIYSGRAISFSGELLEFSANGYIATGLNNVLSFKGSTEVIGFDGKLYTFYTDGPKADPEDNLLL